jgi:predicted Ser/Thr protein kinase
MGSDLAGACLGDETIAAMLEGGLAEDDARRARAHIGRCDACRQIVAAAIDIAPASTIPGFAAARDRVIAIGTVISGRYRIDRLIGEGGMGRVFAAHQLGLDRTVAIKVLRRELEHDATVHERFQREARLVAALTSDHVVRVHDAGALDTGEPYLVMEMLEGEDLATIVARGAIRADVATAWILAACDALGEAHALGIVHRDIKPSNLMLTRHQRIKVLDFGLAKLVRASITNVGMVLGSPHYIAPEQIVGSGDVDLRADIWSLGATLYHLVTGTPPFAAPTIDEVFSAILESPPPPLERVPAELAPVIRRCLARDPAARFGSVGELAAALSAKPRRRIRRLLIAGAALGAAATATVVVLTRSSEAPAPEAPAAIDGPQFSVEPPPGWRVASDAVRARLGATPDMVVLGPTRKSRAAIVIGRIDLDPQEMADLVGATEAYCTELGSESAVTMAAEITSAKPTKVGAFTGCEVLGIGNATKLELRSVTIGNGKLAVAIVCSRDKASDPSVDAACTAVASSLVAK